MQLFWLAYVAKSFAFSVPIQEFYVVASSVSRYVRLNNVPLQLMRQLANKLIS